MQLEAVRRRLLLAKYLLRLADAESGKPEPLCSASILLQHDAVELVLALGAEHHNVGSSKSDFMQYFGDIEKAISQTLLHRGSMRRLNSARVALKHNGTTPSRQDVLSSYSAVCDFMRDDVPLIFGLAFEDVSLADIIEAEPVRDCLKRSDNAFGQNDLAEAGRAIAEAFARLLRHYGIAPVSHGEMRQAMREYESQMDSSGRPGALSRLGEVVDELYAELALIRQGIDTRALNVFRSLTPAAAISVAGTAHFISVGAAEPAIEEQLRFCYDFVVDSALQMQQSHSSILDYGGGRYIRSRFGIV